MHPRCAGCSTTEADEDEAVARPESRGARSGTDHGARRSNIGGARSGRQLLGHLGCSTFIATDPRSDKVGPPNAARQRSLIAPLRLRGHHRRGPAWNFLPAGPPSALSPFSGGSPPGLVLGLVGAGAGVVPYLPLRLRIASGLLTPLTAASRILTPRNKYCIFQENA